METALDFALGETADMIRETTRRFAADRIAPKAADIDEQNKFDRSPWPEKGALGLQGITDEEEYGGPGRGYLMHCVAMEVGRRARAADEHAYRPESNRWIHKKRLRGQDSTAVGQGKRVAGYG